jgi:hypothetical protein
MKKALFVIVLMLLVAVSKGQEVGDSYYVAVQKIKSGQILIDSTIILSKK